jgi:hypothetical protein
MLFPIFDLMMNARDDQNTSREARDSHFEMRI